ncbi:hypothetical protein QN277_007833 [Acacia crassicarpa]|uniref:Uncharacterized protein n=1 Tax=Acacia crassicarpa TaxID=499986 RepID=A0AAE1IX02_9FABA|nr:hypothetical protein QN277_007833 [Acacia crassicarpa]
MNQGKPMNLENGDSATTIHGRKRKSRRVDHMNPMAKQKKLGKRIISSLTKPSYVQRLRSNKLRSQHHGILRKLLHKLVNQQNWVEASGVLSVYLRATVKETSPFENRFKYLVLLRLLKHVEKSNIKPRRIENIYDIWMAKNGQMKDEPMKSRSAVDLDFILFSLMQGNIEEAYQGVLCLKQRSRSDHDSISNMVMGLVYYEKWYSCIPKEFRWRGSELFDSLGTSYMEEEDFSSQADHQSFEYSILLPNKLLDDYYEGSVRHLHTALESTPPAPAALLPLIQLLLMGGQVDEALHVLEKQCCSSISALPSRLKAILFERFNSNNSLLLASCFEDSLKKDPTCCESLAKLVKMHEDENYSVESLVEMIAHHLDATNAEHGTWKQFADCFFRLSDKDEYRQHTSSFLRSTPKVFTKKSWSLRCKWWLNKHFSTTILGSEIEAGDLQLLTYKAACASYMYGKKFRYVMDASYHLKENDKDLLKVLDDHRRNSYGFYKEF